MKKKVLALVLIVALVATLVIGLVGCNKNDNSNFKVGLICLHGDSSTYDANFIDAMKQACNELGLKENQLIIKTDIEENAECKEAAEDLVEDGCNVIFADSFGHEKFIKEVAIDNPEVQFVHATGVTAHTANIANFHNAFAAIYQGRYLAGVAAGQKLKEMMQADSSVQAKIGYVGAHPYAEVISGYTSFYLGVKSVVEDVTMDVKYTGSWYDEQLERNAAVALIQGGCALISQHADSMGAPGACENANPKVPNVSYNGSTVVSCPNTYIVSSKINWVPYFKYMISKTMAGETFETDYCGTLGDTLKDGAVALTDFNGNEQVVSSTAKQLVNTAYQAIKAGTLQVFDCSKFTVTVRAAGTNGENDKGLNVNATVDQNRHLTAYLADVDGDYQGETNVVSNGVFVESGSDFRSAPYFDLIIDGINILD